MRQDLAYAIRTFWKSPGFTLVAVFTLALGIGANTAIFSIVNAVMIRPLPFPNPERLVVLRDADTRDPKRTGSVTAPDFADWRARNQTLEHVAAFHYGNFILTGGDEPESLSGVFVSHDFLNVMGVKPLIGRDLSPDEDQPRQRAHVALISHGLWKRRFAESPSIVGKTLSLNSETYAVIGVMPEAFKYPSRAVDFWVPAGLDPTRIKDSKSAFLQAVARLKPNVAIGQARADLNAVARQLSDGHPNTNQFGGVSVTGLLEQTLGNFRLALLTLSGAVAFVLLIACANAANLLLAKATARQKEISIRLALGAGRWRIIRQLLTESLVLALVSGACGVLFAAYGVDALAAYIPASPGKIEVGLDRGVLLFTLLVSLLTGVVFGLYPAWQAAKTSLSAAMKEGGGKNAAGTGSQRFRNALIIGEVALTLSLLIGAGLLLESFRRVQKIDPGFDATNILTMNVSLPHAKYQDPARQSAFFRQALQNIQTLPGVKSAAAVTNLPLGNSLMASSFRIEGHADPQPGEEFTANDCKVSSGYFRTMGVRLVRGRDFTERDGRESAGVIIINQALADLYFPNEDPLGKRITIGTPEEEELYGKPVSREIIAIVGNSRFTLDEVAQPELYVSYQQLPVSTLTVVVKTIGDPADLSKAVRAAIYQADPNQPVRAMRVMTQLFDEAVTQRRFSALLIGLFAAIALTLAVVGIYGVMSYAVTQRTNEIGVRIALGAQTSDVLKLIVGQGAKLIAAGVVIGLVVSFALLRVMKTLLFEVNATEPSIYGSVVVILFCIALLACYIPARRVMKVDPMVALRRE